MIWKEVSLCELCQLAEILAQHIGTLKRGGDWAEVASNLARFSKGENGYSSPAVGYLIHAHFGPSIEVRLDEKGRVFEVEGSKLALRRAATPSGRFARIRGGE